MAGETWRRNRGVLGPTVAGFAKGLLSRRDEFRHHVLREAWTVAKRFGADPVVNIEAREIAAFEPTTVLEGPIDDNHRLLLAALARGLGCRTFFEIGTNRGWTTWTVAHNNPELSAFTLDVPPGTAPEGVAMALPSDDRRFFDPASQCGEAFRGTPEDERITQLFADSAEFDFTPYHGTIDLVYIDGAHTYDYVMRDSDNALRMLTPAGTIAWDDYTINPGVLRAVREIAGRLGEPVYHVFGTRMALYSRAPLVTRLPYDSNVSMPSV